MENEVNEAPNFFKVFMGINCVKSRSMKQPFCFILDKKSMIRWSDNKIGCSYTQAEERLSSTLGLIALCVYYLQYTQLSSR